MGEPGCKRRCSVEIALLLLFLLWTSQASAALASDGEGLRRASLRVMSRAIFEQLRHAHHHRKCSPSGCPPPPPPLSNRGGDEDDVHPVYGVAKRLVPTGPNPLHN